MNDLERLFSVGTLGWLSDGQLLGRFLEGQEAAVAAGTASGSATFLTTRMMTSKLLATPRLIAALTLVLGALATGVALFRMAAPGPAAKMSAPPTAPPTAKKSAQRTASPEAPADAGRLVLTPG